MIALGTEVIVGHCGALETAPNNRISLASCANDATVADCSILAVDPGKHVRVRLDLGPCLMPVHGGVHAIPLKAALAEIVVMAFKTLEALSEDGRPIAGIARNGHVHLELLKRRRRFRLLCRCRGWLLDGLGGLLRRLSNSSGWWGHLRSGLRRCGRGLCRRCGPCADGDVQHPDPLRARRCEDQCVVDGALYQRAAVAVLVNVGQTEQGPSMEHLLSASSDRSHGLRGELPHLGRLHEDVRRAPLPLQVDVDHLVIGDAFAGSHAALLN
mmetsp:Transcript_93978/g.275082  ORF Transcript_93978/g.275082 Transcript_93978/m.275082 type:complete len:270 (+) Transcript_93978:1146-1955(+)